VASVDVAIPCYNYARFLGACVGSVLSQDVGDLRVLIIDNASTDDSVAVARLLAASDPRIEVRAQSVNRGAQASYNEAVDWASADYFAILCADDLLAPGALRRAVTVMEANPSVTFALGADIEFRDGGALPALADHGLPGRWRIVPGVRFIEDRCSDPVASASVVVRTVAQKAAGHYRTSLPFTDDLEMLLRLAALGDVAVSDVVQGVRRLHGANMADVHRQTRAHDLLQREAAFESFFAQEGGRLVEARQLRRLASRFLAERAYWWGACGLARGRRREAADLLGFALSRWPSMALLPPVNFLFRQRKASRGRVPEAVRLREAARGISISQDHKVELA
jgi:glycosyltransferase involved in cell wall biosynthesis